MSRITLNIKDQETESKIVKIINELGIAYEKNDNGDTDYIAKNVILQGGDGKSFGDIIDWGRKERTDRL